MSACSCCQSCYDIVMAKSATAPRNGLISGCYPLDPHYKSLPQRDELIAIKQKWEI